MGKDIESRIREDDLIIPIYVDTNALLDVIASIEGGFSFLEKITSRTTNSNKSDQTLNVSGGTEFGIPNVLNLIKVSLGGAFSWMQNRENLEELASEKYHTYGSLFQRLRYALKTQKVQTSQIPFKTFDGSSVSWDKIRPHTFVEIQGIFFPNPLVDSMGTINGLIHLMEIFANSASKIGGSTKQKPQLITSSHNLFNVDPTMLHQMSQIKKIIQGLLDDIEKQDIRTVVANIPSGQEAYRVVISLFTEYLRDKTFSELLFKEYKLFGKVVGKLTDSTSHIDLLQGTSLRGLDESAITDMLSAFNQPNSGIKLPTAETKINGPALQVIPIAIYV